MQKCEKMLLGGNGSPTYRKQSIWRGCPTAADAPNTIFRRIMMKHFDSWRSENNKKKNIVKICVLKNRVLMPDLGPTNENKVSGTRDGSERVRIKKLCRQLLSKKNPSVKTGAMIDFRVPTLHLSNLLLVQHRPRRKEYYFSRYLLDESFFVFSKSKIEIQKKLLIKFRQAKALYKSKEKQNTFF